MPRRLRQPIVFVPALIVVAIVGVWWFGFRAEDDATASASTTKQVVEVTRGSMSESVSAEGTVAAAQTDDLSFESSGTVTAVNVKAGDTVTSGEVLATIDSAKLQAAVTAAEADLADAKAKLSDDRSAGASDAQISADESSVESANDALTNANEALAGASLVATFDGTVSSVDLTVGEQLGSDGTSGTDSTGSDTGTGQSTDPLGSGNTNPSADNSSETSTAQIQVVSTGRFTVELVVASADIDSVAVGQTAAVTPSTSSSSSGEFRRGGPAGFFIDGGSAATNGSSSNSSGSNAKGSDSGTGATSSDAAAATGLVTEVGKVPDASSGVATYPVTIAFDVSAEDVYVGSTVTGDVATNTRENVVQVSALAITTTNGVSTVTVATDGTSTGPTETRTVTTGLSANGNTEITSGLKAGEKVIVTITRPSGSGGFSPPSGELPGGLQGGPPDAVTGSGG